MGVLLYDSWCHISKHSQQISGLISFILTKNFIHSILVCNKTYLHFQVTALYLSKIFSTVVIASLGQATTWQNRGVKRPHSWAFCPKQWWAFYPECIFFFLYTQECWQFPMKRNRHEIKENNIIYCEIIANSDYSKKDTNNRLASMSLILHKTWWKFDQAWLIDIMPRYSIFKNIY